MVKRLRHLTTIDCRKRGIAKGGTPLPLSFERAERASEKRKNRRDVNYLKSLILHRRYKKYDKRSFDSVPILESITGTSL